MKRILAGRNQFENAIKTPVATRDLKCSSRVQSERGEASDEGQVEVLIAFVVGNIYERRVRRQEG
jgi:hypothetical protein